MGAYKKSSTDLEVNSSSASSILTSDIECLVDRLRIERFRNSTKNNYYCIWCTFNQFYLKLDRKPDNWEERLTLFVGYLIGRNRKSSTIKSYVSAIRAVLTDVRVLLEEDKCLLSSLTHACKQRNDKLMVKIPIRKGLLHLLLAECKKLFLECGQCYLAITYKAIFAAAYYGMLRIGELTTGNHPIKAVDVHMGSNKDKLLFILRSSKTHWKNMKPQQVKICEVNNKSSKLKTVPPTAWCPFRI